MRLVILTSIVLAAGCASAPKEAPVEKEVAIDATNIVEAQKAGYKVVDKDGETLYCKRNLKTGTRLRQETACLSEKEWQELRDATKRGVEAMRRTTPPPHGT